MPPFLKYLAGATTAIVLGILLLNRSAKTKEEFIKIEGAVTYFDKQFENLPTRDLGKYRYLVIGGTSRVFDIFIGNEPGDFSPEFERMDELTIGDTVTLYYDDNSYTEGQLVNNLARFIDRDKEPIFIESSKTDKTLGYIVVGLGFALVIVILTLKKIGKID